MSRVAAVAECDEKGEDSEPFEETLATVTVVTLLLILVLTILGVQACPGQSDGKSNRLTTIMSNLNYNLRYSDVSNRNEPRGILLQNWKWREAKNEVRNEAERGGRSRREVNLLSVDLGLKVSSCSC